MQQTVSADARMLEIANPSMIECSVSGRDALEL